MSNSSTENCIHPTAIIADTAIIGKNTRIGPYSVIGEKVVLGDHITIHSHVIIEGKTHIDDHCSFFPFSSIGTAPQDLKYCGEDSELIIGHHNIIREHVTINPGTKGGNMVTLIGNHCLFMVGSHIAHDCTIGDHVIMANNATLAGHVKVGDFAIIGGLSAIHQFVRIGKHAMIGGMSGVESDIIPYGQAVGERANLCGLNLIGLKRRNFKKHEIHSLRQVYRLLFSPEGTLQERVEDTEKMFHHHPDIMDIINFIKENSSRTICQPKTSSASLSSERK